MKVLGFYARKKRGDTVIVEWKDEIVALDRERLELAVGCGSAIWVDKGDLLPSVYPGWRTPKRVEIPAEVLKSMEQGFRQQQAQQQRQAQRPAQRKG